jgi:hypothetical protein
MPASPPERHFSGVVRSRRDQQLGRRQRWDHRHPTGGFLGNAPAPTLATLVMNPAHAGVPWR